MADVGRDGGADLSADALVGAQQRQVSVGRRAGDDLNQAGVVEVAETADDVAVEGIEIVESGGKEPAPEARRLGEMGVAGLDEVGLILACGEDLARKVLGKFGYEERMSQLLQQNGGEVDVEIGGNTVTFQIAQHAQDREVGLRGGFVQPLHPVRPGAVVDHIRQVRVQRESQIARGSVLCLRQE